ncbi:Transcriptional regulatory protein [Pararobbsia alpina]|uniref:LysR family transcriptional regulator n=1 Tax=Pararobbsia alpina TaxID=621374 RepID=UPI0039A786D4
MNINDLRAFVAVVKSNSLTRAAETLFLTQSAVSRRIQHLEESLGAELFDRATKPPRVTALAHRVYALAVPLLQGVDRLVDVTREDAPPTGLFRIGLTRVVSDIALFDAVLKLKDAFPDLEVQSTNDWGPQLFAQLENGALDAATLMLPAVAVPPASVSARRIATLEVMVVQSARKPLVPERATLGQLAKQGWILNPEGCGYRAALEHAFDMKGQPLRLSVDTHGTDTQLRLIAAGLGLGLVPKSVLNASPLHDDLAVVDTRGFSLNLAVWLAHGNHMGNLRGAVEVLEGALLEAFASSSR